jgi:hypothetical protein
MKVTLRPLAQDSWSGVVKYKNCYEDISKYYTRSGGIYTGLSKEVADRLGEKLGRDLSQHSEFWDTFYIRTVGKDIILDLEDPMDELKYHFLRNHKRVKNSMLEHKATANFVLLNQEQESQRMNVFGRAKRKAGAELDKMTPEEMRKALRIFGKSAENMSPDVVENRLNEIIEGDPQGFLDKWVNNKSRETQYLIERAVSMNIIRKNKRLYNYGTDVIGHGLEETILYLDDPVNQDVRIAILQQIDGKLHIEQPVVGKGNREPLVVEDKGKSVLSLTPVEEVKESIKDED